MSERSKQIKALKDVFEKARNSPRRESGRLYDLELHGELQHALCVVGEEKIFELKDEIYPYLKDQFSEFREEAIRTLGGCNALHLEEFKDEAYQIWLHDPDKDVKGAALDAWAEYYRDTKDPIILKYLYNILKSEKYTIHIRVYAYYNFVLVAGAIEYPGEHPDILGLSELEEQKELTKAIDWGKVQRIMQQYVPGWGKK